MVRGLLRRAVDGPHAMMFRRFVIVGTVAAGVQTALLVLIVEWGDLQYLLAAAISIETTIILQYFANNAWTFRTSRHTTPRGYLGGLVRTNLVRGSAIPIQLGVLWALVSAAGVQYVLANVVAGSSLLVIVSASRYRGER
ncbi:GtrA family protein [Halobacteriales archaeon QS_1_68_17]|nr:MAG: GtrA family protein [Halobacteriales archaeon QS_1_68_17]